MREESNRVILARVVGARGISFAGAAELELVSAAVSPLAAVSPFAVASPFAVVSPMVAVLTVLLAIVSKEFFAASLALLAVSLRSASIGLAGSGDAIARGAASSGQMRAAAE